MSYNGILNIAYDIVSEPDQGVAVVTKNIGSRTEIVNVFYGRDAYKFLDSLVKTKQSAQENPDREIRTIGNILQNVCKARHVKAPTSPIVIGGKVMFQIKEGEDHIEVNFEDMAKALYAAGYRKGE